MPLELGPELTIAHAAEVQQSLLAAVASHPETLTLDLAGVTDFDSSGVQLLLAAARTQAERGGTLRLARASEAVERALATFGLQAMLAHGAA
jgi:anti-anti-sigma factor